MKEKKKGVLRYVLIASAVVVVAVVVLSQTLGRDAYSSAAEVRSHVVGRRNLENLISGTGVFTPRSSAKVVTRIPAEVEILAVREGDVVQAGDLLVQLNDESYRLAYAQAKSVVVATQNGVLQSLVTLRAGYRGALNALEQSRRAFEKNENLFEARAISEEAYDMSRDAYQTALVAHQSAREQLNLRSGLPLEVEPVLTSERDAQIVASSPEVMQAEINLEIAGNNLGRSRIYSPGRGTVTSIVVSAGDNVPAFAALMQIDSLDDMLAEIQVDEVDIGKVRPGQEAEITSDSILGRILNGEVVEVAPVVKTRGSTRTSTVKVDIREEAPEPAGDLKAGASCTARIVTSIRENSTVIPLSGFIEQSGVNYAYVMKPAEKRGDRQYYRLEKREITTGLSNVNFIEAASGLQEGERIVVGSLNLLRDGVLVTVKEGS